MKQLRLTISTVIAIILLQHMAVANNSAIVFEDVTERVARLFKKDFASAQEVTWEKTQGYLKATFKLNEQRMSAFYSEDGNLLTVVRNLVSTQLPVNLLIDLTNKYSQYWITDLFEMTSDNNTDYYLTIENSEEELVVTSQGTNGWFLYSRHKK